jgi:YD repeat-containing protein
MQDGWGASYFAYDALNRLARRSTPNGDSVYYAYDGVSNLLKLQYPRGMAACYYIYDARNRMARADTPSGSCAYFGYDASSNLARMRLANGAACYYEYDAAERVASIRNVTSAGAPVAYFEYGRDAAGRIVSLARETDVAVYYEYDEVDRLTGETWRKQSDGTQVYAFKYGYDAAGNREWMSRELVAGAVENSYYEYDAANALARRLVQPPSDPAVATYYYYDANGALEKQIEGAETTYFEYGPQQMLTKVTPPAGQGEAWEFAYDGQLNRYWMNRGGTEAYYLWDGLNLLEERDTAGNLLTRYTHGYSPIYGIGSCVEILKPASGSTPEKRYTLVFDHRGTAHVLLDQTGAEVGRRQYDAFGVILSETGSWPVDYAYQANWLTVMIGGKWWGLSAARLYDFATGRFTQRDPLPSLIKVAGSAKGNVLGIFDRSLFAGEALRAMYGESGLMYYRAGTYHKGNGRFIERDFSGYEGSPYNLYPAYFVPARVDPFGLCDGKLIGSVTKSPPGDEASAIARFQFYYQPGTDFCCCKNIAWRQWAITRAWYVGGIRTDSGWHMDPVAQEVTQEGGYTVIRLVDDPGLSRTWVNYLRQDFHSELQCEKEDGQTVVLTTVDWFNLYNSSSKPPGSAGPNAINRVVADPCPCPCARCQSGYHGPKP